MLVKVLREAGYEEALLGLSLSFYDHKIPLLDWELFDGCCEKDITYTRQVFEVQPEGEVFWTTEKYTKAQKIALLLANRESKTNIARDNPDYIRAEKKFLRSICVWLYIQAPRCWWSEYDTYIVGITKNSSSTMHTLDKRSVEEIDFEEDTNLSSISAFNDALTIYKMPNATHYKDITFLKNSLPEGWLQERQICTNYATLQNILNQRDGHRLKYWKQHNEDILEQVEHPELLVKNM